MCGKNLKEYWNRQTYHIHYMYTYIYTIDSFHGCMNNILCSNIINAFSCRRRTKNPIWRYERLCQALHKNQKNESKLLNLKVEARFSSEWQFLFETKLNFVFKTLKKLRSRVLFSNFARMKFDDITIIAKGFLQIFFIAQN